MNACKNLSMCGHQKLNCRFVSAFEVRHDKFDAVKQSVAKCRVCLAGAVTQCFLLYSCVQKVLGYLVDSEKER